ncbi:hypothetical protein FJTKL_06252 [Diaporthe vaccinii]|uniref:Uncharacterized protein n=1 Tax=Diaporthe vaccinii TaxID=105482 RepID=A0ABR4DSX3_9PEZI
MVALLAGSLVSNGVTTILPRTYSRHPFPRRKYLNDTMVKQMPLRWEDRHDSEAPDPLYATVPPPEFIHRSRVDQILDDTHQRALEHAVRSILSTPIAKETFAQIVDGLPLRSVALGAQDHRVLRGDPIDNHPEMCPGALEKARECQTRLNPRDLEVASAALQRYQDTPVGSKASKMPFVELVAVTIHNVAVELFKLVDGAFIRTPYGLATKPTGSKIGRDG